MKTNKKISGLFGFNDSQFLDMNKLSVVFLIICDKVIFFISIEIIFKLFQI